MARGLSEATKVWIDYFTRMYEETGEEWYIKRVMWLRKYGDLKEVITSESKHST